MPEDDALKFHSRVQPMFDDRGCWEWIGPWDKDGYGKISAGHPRRSIRAHRFSWELHEGPIPNGLCVLHRCDNPPCVNPAHLFLGTNAINTRDCIQKGRFAATKAAESWARQRRERTHCKHGHSRDRYGVRYEGYNQWFCRECSRLAQARLRAARGDA